MVEDTGDFDRYGVDFDMYFGDHQTAQNFGHQDMEVYLADSNGSNSVEVTHTSLYVYNLSYEDYIELGKLTPSQEDLLREVMSERIFTQYAGKWHWRTGSTFWRRRKLGASIARIFDMKKDIMIVVPLFKGVMHSSG